MSRLCSAERARREAIDDLIRLGVVRSRRLVGDIGEALAAHYYGVALASNANTPGYDLKTTDGRRVQVRTLRSEPRRERTLMGAMKEPYDALLAIKLSVDYEPLRAIEVPRTVLERHTTRTAPERRGPSAWRPLKGCGGSRRQTSALSREEPRGSLAATVRRRDESSQDRGLEGARALAASTARPEDTASIEPFAVRRAVPRMRPSP